MKTFERGRSVKVTLGLGKRALIKKWFDDLGKSSDKYVINDDFSIDYKSDLFLVNTNITKLPNNLTVNGWLDLRNTNITKLPDNLTVHGYLNLTNINITKLPDNLTVNGSLILTNTNITELPDNLTVYGNLYLDNTNITKLPDNLKVKDNIRITIDMKLTYVPGHLKYKINITNE